MTMRILNTVLLLLLVSVLSSCGVDGPEPIFYGEDNCAHCRMTIVDKQFGTELATAKGKFYKFDSIECMSAFEASDDNKTTTFANAWVTDFDQAELLVDRSGVTFVKSKIMRSPMGVGLFAFSSVSEADAFAKEYNGRIVTWDEIDIIVKEAW